MDPGQMELVKLIAGGGPYALAAVLGYLYWLERTERREIQKERNTLLERALTTFGEVRDAIKELKGVIVGRP